MHISESVLANLGLGLFGDSIFPHQGHNTFPATLEYRIKGAHRKDSHAHYVSEELTQRNFKLSLVLLF